MTEPVAPAIETPPSGSPTTVAAFDFDGTLIDGGSVFQFLVSLRGARTVLLATARHSPRLLYAALVGGSVADGAKERYFIRLLGGLPAAEVDRVSAAFAARHLARRLRPGTARRLEWHQAQGHHVVIVSASPEVYVRVAGTILGVDGALGHPPGRRTRRAPHRGIRRKELPGGREAPSTHRAPGSPGAHAVRRQPTRTLGLRQQPG